jgi:hypothetical protein
VNVSETSTNPGSLLEWLTITEQKVTLCAVPSHPLQHTFHQAKLFGLALQVVCTPTGVRCYVREIQGHVYSYAQARY